MQKKRLAVIGGGAAGHQIAHDLSEIMDVTLVDPKTYWEVPMALPRLLVEPTALSARMTFESFLPKAHHVQGHAIGLSDHKVAVDTAHGRQIVAFDFAVISTGSRYLHPLIKAEATTEQERAAEIEIAHEHLQTSRHVVVIGGGPVGVEVTAELRQTFPRLKVTLVHSAKTLLETAPSKFAAWAEESLLAHGANLVLNDLVVDPKMGLQPTSGLVTLKSGRVLEADTVLWAAGTKPVSDFVKASWPALVQANGLIKTDNYLRLEGHPNIFVAGDLTNLPEARLVITASFHVTSIVGNLKALAAADLTTAAKLKAYTPKIPGKGLGKLMVVTLGRRDGLTSLPFGQFRASILARKMKSENMFVDKYRKAVGLNI